MKTVRTLTVPPRHGLNAGQYVYVQWPDKNKWRRFWRWITFRSPPMIGKKMEVMAVSSTTLKVR